jgi:hypothetical protein
MNKGILLAAFVAASFSLSAQKSIYVGKTSIENLKVINYKRYPQAERVIENDTTYFVDWASRQIVIDGDIFPIRAVKKSGNSVEIKYGYHWTVNMIISYDNTGNCVGFKIEL